MTSKDVQVIEKKLSPIMEAVEKIEVVDEKTEHEAAHMLSQLNAVGDAMAEKKAKVYDPAWATVVAIRAEWKPKETILEGAIKAIRAKMASYRTRVQAEANAEAARIAARVGAGKGHLSVESAVRQMEAIEKPVEVVTTGAGVVKYKDHPCMEVMDIELLPLEYHVADEVAIRKAMAAGKQLPGVRYWTEQRPINTR